MLEDALRGDAPAGHQSSAGRQHKLGAGLNSKLVAAQGLWSCRQTSSRRVQRCWPMGCVVHLQKTINSRTVASCC